MDLGWMVADAVTDEPVSSQFSLLTGKTTGKIGKFSDSGGRAVKLLTEKQWFRVPFPTLRNREFS